MVAVFRFLLGDDYDEQPDTPASTGSLSNPTNTPSPSAPPQTAVFVMADSRSVGTSLATASYLTLSAVLNYAYAKKQGYEFKFVRLPSRDRSQCAHPTLNENRGAQWCKLLAAWRIASATSASRVVLLDSDCAIVAHSVRLEDWLARNATELPHHGPPPLDSDFVLLSDHYADVPCNTWCELVLNLAVEWDAPNRATLSLFFAALHDEDGNTGFWVARTHGGAAERLIRRWWDVSDPGAATVWPFEQNAVGALRRARDGLHTTVCVPYDEFFGYGPRSYVHHPVDKPAGQPVMRLVLASIGLGEEGAFQREAEELLASSSFQSLDIDATQAEMAARTAKDPRFYRTCENNLQCKDDKYE